MKYYFIKDHHSEFTVKKMCQSLKTSESGYYRWLISPVSNQFKDNEILKARISEIYHEHGGMAGSPMITADLRDEIKFQNVSEKRVFRLMKEMNIRCKTVKKFKVTTDSKHNEPVAQNLLNRNFTVSAPNTVWVGDITYLKIGKKWFYLSLFIDLFSRIVVGWDLSDSLETGSTLKALNNAILKRNPPKGLMVHSDRGIQYASKAFRELIDDNKFIQSMSRKGNCWDNAVAESFFHTLKTQYTHHISFRNEMSARLGLFNYIEVYYNRRRKHSSNGYKSPMNYEMECAKNKIAA